jgi:UDP-N-acetylglucosamine transferase subunit ALG13
MIFVVFGTIPVPFPRLAEKVDEIAGKTVEDFVIQSGHTNYPFRHAQVEKFFPGSEMDEKITEASLLITHGGYGIIYEALQKNKKIIAVPRIAGEHNHSQVELVRALEWGGHVLAVYDIDQLDEKIAAATDFAPRQIVRGNAGELIDQYISKVFPQGHH